LRVLSIFLRSYQLLVRASLWELRMTNWCS